MITAAAAAIVTINDWYSFGRNSLKDLCSAVVTQDAENLHSWSRDPPGSDRG